MRVAVLFARKDSIYKTIDACDVWDIDRDALKYQGDFPVIAHPPCRAWGGLRHLAKPRDGEKDLAPWAVNQVRKYGGVVEHPKRSQLWPVMGLPIGRTRDEFGGFSLLVNQLWWGHRAEKATFLYICGCDPKDVPIIPLSLEYAHFVIGTHGRRKDNFRKAGREVKKSEREATPPAFAKWLVELALKCS
jgi:hypothetical protein